MKKYFFLIATIGCFSICMAQTGSDAKKNPEPKLMNHIYYVGDSSQLVSMEQGLAAMKTKSKLGGFAGSSTSYIIEGPSSTMHISNHYPSFAIKLSGMGGMALDPSQMMRLYRFETKDKSRESVISKIGVMGHGSNTNTDGIKCTSKQTGDGVYIIVPAEALEPGEYGFVNLMMPKDVSDRRNVKYEAFAFAVGR